MVPHLPIRQPKPPVLTTMKYTPNSTMPPTVRASPNTKSPRHKSPSTCTCIDAIIIIIITNTASAHSNHKIPQNLKAVTRKTIMSLKATWPRWNSSTYATAHRGSPLTYRTTAEASPAKQAPAAP